MATPTTEEKKFTLSVLIDSERNRVLFAEANSDLVDVLFSFMTLPLGTIVRLLEKHFDPQEVPMGSLNTLYDGLKKLGSSCFRTEEAKLMFLYPRNSSEIECQKLKINIDDTEPTKYFICEDMNCKLSVHNRSLYVSTFNVTRCRCGKLMNREVDFKASDVSAEEEGFTSGMASFIITEDLHVMPNFAGSSLELLKSFGIKHMTAVQEKCFVLGLKEVINLLKCSIFSKTALSDMLLHTDKVKPETFLLDMSQMSETRKAKNMVLKVTLHKSTKKVFFAQAEEDFIDCLFSMLAIPLGTVASLLGGNTSLGSIDNLYKSISSANTLRYFESGSLREMLICPKLPPLYGSKNKIFNLSYEPYPHLAYEKVNVSGRWNFSLMTKTNSISYDYLFTGPVDFKLPMLNCEFVRGPAAYMVTDDLQVTPLSSISSMFFLNKFGISLDDVEEMTLSIGAQEALGILKASLSTTSALTNGLKLMLNKQVKQEK